MRKVAVTAAVLAAVFLWTLATLPPRPVLAVGAVTDDVCRRTLAGAFHIHSTRSDGTGDFDAIAAAASRAGLRFAVITDHGDATRPIHPPSYRSGVLVIDAVEISTRGGHYIALDMPASPYPLAGEADAVVEDVARLGGFGIAAHPDSKKPELAWKAWGAPIDGIEWLNMDSEWRDESRARLAGVVPHYLLRPGPAVASLIDRPVDTLRRWDAELARRPLVGLAGHDAHGGLLEGGGGGLRSALGIPSYEASFRAFGVRAIVDREPTGSAAEDARLVIDAIRQGRVFTAIDAIAGPACVDYRASVGGRVALMGETVPFEPGARVVVHATVPRGGRIMLLRDEKDVAESPSGELAAAVSDPGAYRVEVRAPSAPGTPPVPWIVTNPVYLRGQEEARPALPAPEPSVVREIAPDVRIEKDPTSTGTITSSAGQVTVDYGLRAGERASQYVALVVSLSQPSSGADALAFDVRSSAPMRISAQLRFDSSGGARWAKSVYADSGVRRVVIPFSQLVPIDVGTNAASPSFSSASSLLFVVDLTNAAPGQAGEFEVSNLAFVALR